MLWYKGWLETRYRLVFLLLFLGLMLSLQYYALHDMQNIIAREGPKSMVLGMMAFTALPTLIIFVIMAGAGIVTQTLLATRGIHGSMQYTLALPVSRIRLLMVRASMGWVGAAIATGIFCCALWMLYPQLRAMGTPAELAEHVGTLVGCASVIYFLSVLLATFLDDQGRALGSTFSLFVLWWFSLRGQMPVSIDIVRAMGKGSPLVTHVMPWTPIGVSLGVSVVLFFAALQVARMREY